MTFALYRNGVEIERHKHKETCVVAAIERGWAFRDRVRIMLFGSVEAKEVKEGNNESEI